MHYLNIHLKQRSEDWSLPLWHCGSWLQSSSPLDCCWLDCWSIFLCPHPSQHVPSPPLSATLPCTLLRPWLCITHRGVSNEWEPLLSKRGLWRRACEWWFVLDSNKLCVSEGGNVGAQRRSQVHVGSTNSQGEWMLKAPKYERGVLGWRRREGKRIKLGTAYFNTTNRRVWEGSTKLEVCTDS